MIVCWWICAAALRLGHALEVAEGLEDRDGEIEILAHAAHIGGRAVEGEQVVLEDLHAIEAGGCGSLELVRQGAGQADGGDGFGQAALRHHTSSGPATIVP